MDDMKKPESELSELKMDTAKPDQKKDWKELHEHEKIERLRRVLKEQESIIRNLNDYVNRLIGHEHLNGKIVQPIGHPGAESTGGFYYRERGNDWF